MSDKEETRLVMSKSISSMSAASNLGKMPYTDGPPEPGVGHELPDISNHTSNATAGQRLSQSHESETGELIDGDIVLSQFHADAIKQAGAGKYQLIAAIIVGLGLTGHAMQVFAIPYIMPSAEVEFCIVENEKNWLGGITLLGIGVGGILWGGLAGRTGRRKSLISCLAVGTVFSVISAFMPTYGPFMMARFCAACGVGGVIPAGACYIAEISPPSIRARLLGIFGVFGIIGGLLAGYLAVLILPNTGEMIILENREHFSAWHKYLLVTTLPTLISLFGLFWLSESPRWLLENGREVEALGVYQSIYKKNHSRGGYTLTELELPGSRFRHISPPSVLADMAISISAFIGSFTYLFRKSYFKSTILLLAVWAASMFVFTGLAIYTTEHNKAISAGYYYRNTIITSNRTYRNTYFNTSLNNHVYLNCTFVNCTFQQLFMIHITFSNSTFINTEFSNVKTSGTEFEFSILEDVSLIDTDLTQRHFIECIMTNVSYKRLSTECDRDFDYNIYFRALCSSLLGLLSPAFVMIGLCGEAVYRCGKTRIATVCFAFSIVLSITLSFMYHEVPIIWATGAAAGLLLCGVVALTIYAIEFYRSALRCSAIGLFVFVGYLAALIAKPLYALLPVLPVAASIISSIIIVVPFMSSIILREPSSNLI